MRKYRRGNSEVVEEPKNIPTKFTVNISGEDVELTISVNKDGNLVLGGVGCVCYEMFNEEMTLVRPGLSYGSIPNTANTSKE